MSSSLVKESLECPKCNRHIESNKQRLIKCVCGADLIIVKINKKYLVCDVTPDDKTTE